LYILTDIHTDTGEEAVVKAYCYNGAGTLIATAHKREHKKEFHDYLEKAETGAIGRVLAMVGYGTQFAEEFDLPEGKLVDAPVEPRKNANSVANQNAKADEKRLEAQERARKAQEERQAKDAAASTATSTPTPPTENKLTEQQRKAIGNMLTMKKKKSPDLDIDAFVTEFASQFGKATVDEFTNEEARQFITHINQMKN
jgi:hypothetical protein